MPVINELSFAAIQEGKLLGSIQAWPARVHDADGSDPIILVGPVAVTRKACDKALMEREKNFLLGIRTSAQWEEKDGFLILRGQMGEIKFQRAL